MRKFLVGYDPQGETLFVGDKASQELSAMLLYVDTIEERKKKLKIWRKIKNRVSELHWKTIRFLVDNYDTIFLPDFRVSEMLRGKRLGRMTKRLLCMFSFYSFKERLQYKCDVYNRKLIIVDESYTSKTCGCCGVLNDVGSSEVYTCSSCGSVFDRDVNGSRNILIKNIHLLRFSL